MLVCCLYKEAYLHIFKRVPFYTAVAGSGKVGLVNQVNHTSWVAVVTPTDRPKSIRNRCVIELFCVVVCVVTLTLWHVRWCMGFCHRTESDLSLFLSYDTLWLLPHTVCHGFFLLMTFYVSSYGTLWLLPNTVRHSFFHFMTFYVSSYGTLWLLPNTVRHSFLHLMAFYVSSYGTQWLLPNTVRYDFVLIRCAKASPKYNVVIRPRRSANKLLIHSHVRLGPVIGIAISDDLSCSCGSFLVATVTSWKHMGPIVVIGMIKYGNIFTTCVHWYVKDNHSI